MIVRVGEAQESAIIDWSLASVFEPDEGRMRAEGFVDR